MRSVKGLWVSTNLSDPARRLPSVLGYDIEIKVKPAVEPVGRLMLALA
jgi:hypothetical protein